MYKNIFNIRVFSNIKNFNYKNILRLNYKKFYHQFLKNIINILYKYMTKFQEVAECANDALNKVVCAAVSAAALEQYGKIVHFIKSTLCFDINELFGLIALLAVLCWVSQWISEIIHFVTKTIPKFIKNLCNGKFSLCLLDCDRSRTEHKSSSCSTKSTKY